jgi:hypothetical protein
MVGAASAFFFSTASCSFMDIRVLALPAFVEPPEKLTADPLSRAACCEKVARSMLPAIKPV